MINKVVRLKNGRECFVVEEIIIDRRKYCLAYEVDTKEEVLYNRFMILEEKIENGNIVVSGVDTNERTNIMSKIMEKIRNSVEDSNV